MQIEAYNDADAFAERAAEWRALTARSLARTPFQTNEFQRVWWSHFGSGDLCLLAARADDGALVGLVNMFVDPDGVLRWVGGEEIADYLDVIAAPGELESVRMAVFEWLAGPHAPDWKRAQLSNIPEWTGTPEHWRALAAERGWAAAVSELDVCPVVPLPATFEEYLAQIDSKQRREIRRKRRRAEGSEDDVSWRIAAPADDIAADTETFLDLMARSHPDKAAFLSPEMQAAFRDIFQTMHAAGWLQLAFLSVAEREVACYASFDYAGRIWVYNSGLDPASSAALSPGWVLLTYLIEHAVETGHTHFDFMQGDEDYKYRFGGQTTKVFRLTIDRH